MLSNGKGNKDLFKFVLAEIVLFLLISPLTKASLQMFLSAIRKMITTLHTFLVVEIQMTSTVVNFF